ncbi:MAG: NAD-dependent epimerase/dehydratase family protein [Halobacteriales archaeon]
MAELSEPVAILGSDGYTGWSLATFLLEQGHDVVGVDDFTRRTEAAPSVTPIAEHAERAETANARFDGHYEFTEIDIAEYDALEAFIEDADPASIVNLAQIPAAPYSMIDVDHAWGTQQNNIEGALNLMWALRNLDRRDTHVVQLATMGEYGTPETPIPEGFLDDGRPAPKSPGSLYHSSKVNTTVNTRFCSETWDIPVTEIYQGIVYGLPETADETLLTRFDVDAVWGTVLNRFTAQAAIGEPLTVYGQGGQKRAMLSIDDCIRCLTLALENPPGPGVAGRHPYRAINQFDESYRVKDLADMVADHTGAEIAHLENPREEDDSEHFYDPDREVLDQLGYEPSATVEEVFKRTYEVVNRYTDRIPVDELRPDVYWDEREPVAAVGED